MIAVVVAVTRAAYADDFILLPSSARAVAGATGSKWRTEHYIRNDGDLPMKYVRSDCSLSVGCEQIVPGHSTHLLDPAGGNRQMMYLYLADTSRVFVSTVLREVEHAVEPLGTSVPSVASTEFRQQVQLLNVPVGVGSRLALRVYFANRQTAASTPASARIRFFDIDAELKAASVLLAETTVAGESFGNPAALFDLSNKFSSIREARRLRIEVTLTDGAAHGAQLWAMASVTDDATHDVALIVPF